MLIPRYKIGDSVVIKKWFFYGMVEILGAYWNTDLQEWRYTVKDRNGFVRHCRGEEEILPINYDENIINEYNNKR